MGGRGHRGSGALSRLQLAFQFRLIFIFFKLWLDDDALNGSDSKTEVKPYGIGVNLDTGSSALAVIPVANLDLAADQDAVTLA